MINFLKLHFLALITLFSALAYVAGFFWWNFYLSSYGFFEFNVIQARYLSTGLLFLVPLFICATFFIIILKSKFWNIPKFLLLLLFSMLFVYWLFGFKDYFFNLPQYLGGARPIATSIIASPDEIVYLANFGISAAENAKGKPPVQTSPICLIYQNDEYALFFNSIYTVTSSSTEPSHKELAFDARVISLRRDQFTGFSGSFSQYPNSACNLSGLFYDGLIFLPLN